MHRSQTEYEFAKDRGYFPSTFGAFSAAKVADTFRADSGYVLIHLGINHAVEPAVSVLDDDVDYGRRSAGIADGDARVTTDRSSGGNPASIVIVEKGRASMS